MTLLVSNVTAKLLHTALQRLDWARLERTAHVATRAELTQRVTAIATTVQECGEIPEEFLADPHARLVTREVAYLLYGTLVREISSGRSYSIEAVVPLLEGFRLVWGQLDRLDEPNLGADTISLGNETIELAHDLRSPLTSILFLADTLRRGQSGPVGDVQQRQLTIIYSAALRLVSLANDVIGLTQRGDQMLERKPSYFSLREVMESVVELVQPLADERKLALRVLVHGPDQRIGHPTVLSRIFLNLTTNALKYTNEGMVELTARGGRANLVELSVRDTGRGLDEETIANLFQPFHPGSNGKRGSLDTYGLGLTICQRLARALSAELCYETDPSWGTRFYFAVDLPPAMEAE